VTGPRTYEITFTGQAGRAVRAEFSDCQIALTPQATTLRAELPDQCALAGLIQRVIDLRLDITSVLRVSPPGPDSYPSCPLGNSVAKMMLLYSQNPPYTRAE